MRFKIDWANLVVGSKFSVFALFYFVFEGNFLSTSPWGAYIWRGDLTEVFFLRYWFGGGLIHRGAYFRNFTVFLNSGQYCERQRREPLGVSWGKLLPQKMLKSRNLEMLFSLVST